MPPPDRRSPPTSGQRGGGKPRGVRGGRLWQWCVACDQPMNDVYACSGRRCLALYCCMKCADFDRESHFHEKECGCLDVPEMFLHRVAVRSQDKRLPKLIFKKTRNDFIECAEGLMALSSESNTAFCDATAKWAKFRGEKDLIEKSASMKKKFEVESKRSGTRKVHEKEALPDWDTLCRGLEKEKEKNNRATFNSSQGLFPDSDDETGKGRKTNVKKCSTTHNRVNSSYQRNKQRR